VRTHVDLPHIALGDRDKFDAYSKPEMPHFNTIALATVCKRVSLFSVLCASILDILDTMCNRKL